jgi:hypothetical protein
LRRTRPHVPITHCAHIRRPDALRRPWNFSPHPPTARPPTIQCPPDSCTAAAASPIYPPKPDFDAVFSSPPIRRR